MISAAALMNSQAIVVAVGPSQSSSRMRMSRAERRRGDRECEEAEQQHNLNQFQVAHHIKTNYQGINLPSESRKRRDWNRNFNWRRSHLHAHSAPALAALRYVLRYVTFDCTCYGVAQQESARERKQESALCLFAWCCCCFCICLNTLYAKLIKRPNLLNT